MSWLCLPLLLFDEGVHGAEADGVFSPALPELLGARQGLSFGWDEADEAGEVDDEGADVGGGFGRCADDVVVPEQDVQDPDLVFGEQLGGGRVGGVAGAALEVHDAPGGDGVEGEALAQVVGVVEAPVLDAGAGLEDSEELLDGPACLVPPEDAQGVVPVRAALGGEQQPVGRLLQVWRRVGLGGADGEQPERFLARAVERRDDVELGGAHLEAGGPLPPGLVGAVVAARGDPDGPGGEDRELGGGLPQAPGRAVGGEDPAPGAPAGAHQQAAPAAAGGGEQLPEVPLAVADGDHAGPRAGVGELAGALQALQPAGAVLRVAAAEVAVDVEDAERAARLGDGQPGVDADAERPVVGAADLVEAARRAGQRGVVQVGGVLDGEHHPLPGAALDGRLPVSRHDVLHAHPAVRQQPVGRLLRGLAGEDLRDPRAGGILPRPPHGGNAGAHAPVGVGAAGVLDVGPVHAAGDAQVAAGAEGCARPARELLPPVVGQRLDEHFAGGGRAAAPPFREPIRGARAAQPAAGGVAGALVLRGDVGVDGQRALAGERLPVVGQPVGGQRQDVRGEVAHPRAGQDQEAVVLDQQAEVGGPRVRGPADERVARPLAPLGGAEADAAEPPVAPGDDPVVEHPAGAPRPAVRVVGLDHRPPQAPVAVRDRLQPHAAEFAQRGGQLDIGVSRLDTPPGLAGRDGRARARLRQPDPQPLRQPRQRPVRLRHARLAARVHPAGLRAQAARQRTPRPPRLARRPLQPRERAVREVSKPDLHDAGTVPESDRLVKCVPLTGHAPPAVNER